MRRYFASRTSLLTSLSADSSFRVLLGVQVAWLSLKLNPDWLCTAAILLGTNLSGLASTLLVSASRTAQLASDVASPFFSGKLSSTSRYFTCSPSDFSEEVSDDVFFAAKRFKGEI
jgi:hypothetical protein